MHCRVARSVWVRLFEQAMARDVVWFQRDMVKNVFALCVAVSVLVTFFVGRQFFMANPVNDICTNPSKPVQFIQTNHPFHNNMYGQGFGAGFAAEQKAAYPDLADLNVTIPAGRTLEDLFDVALDAARSMVQQGVWSFVDIDTDTRRIQGLASWVVARWESDVVVQVLPGATKDTASIGMRLKMRLGRFDLGMNKARIDRFFAEFQ